MISICITIDTYMLYRNTNKIKSIKGAGARRQPEASAYRASAA